MSSSSQNNDILIELTVEYIILGIVSFISLPICILSLGACYRYHLRLKKKKLLQNLEQKVSKMKFRNPYDVINGPCSICLIELGLEVIQLPNCSHQFHEKCIKDWLVRNELCPLCRTDSGVNLNLDIGSRQILINHHQQY